MSHITYDRSKPFGQLTAETVNQVRAAQASILRLMAVANQIAAGGASPAFLEIGNPEGAANFGVPTARGADFYSNLQSLKSSLDAFSSLVMGDMDLG